MTAFRPLAFGAALAFAACGDPFVDDTSLGGANVAISWADAPTDGLIAMLVTTPPSLDRLLATPLVCVTSSSLSGFASTPDIEVQRAGRTLAAMPEPGREGCVRLALASASVAPVAPGDRLTIALSNALGEHRKLTIAVPALDQPRSHHSLAAIGTADGTTWSATAQHGLIGLTADGRVAQYLGVSSTAPWDAAAHQPQSAMVLAIAPSGARAMWLATATTGVSWFDPGPDPIATTDDTWIHGQPIVGDTGRPTLSDELAQTPLAIAASPDDPSGLWVATLNGVYHARRGPTAIDFVRVADGPALAIAVDDEARVWVGLSTQVEFTEPDDPSGPVGGATHVVAPPAEGAQLVIDPRADPPPAGDDHQVWSMPDEDAVTALLPQLGRVWIGTPYGLQRGAFRGDRVSFEPAPAALPLGDVAVVSLAASKDGLWIAARAECALDGGKLLRAHVDVLGDIVAVDDLTDNGFGEKNFAWVGELASGEVLVSTLVPRLPGAGSRRQHDRARLRADRRRERRPLPARTRGWPADAIRCTLARCRADDRRSSPRSRWPRCWERRSPRRPRPRPPPLRPIRQGP
ncbi:MAG: hypothetical protein U1F43_07915 [Myxococcota bacterium]